MVPVLLIAPALPICTANKPPRLVCIVLVSEYNTGPANELLRMESLSCMAWLGNGLPTELRATPW